MRNLRFLPSLCVVMAASLPAAMIRSAKAQTADVTTAHTAPSAATSATVVPMLVRYSGVATHSNGNAAPSAASITFLIFKEEKGGEPLWIETQNVATDAAGHYEIYLGSTYNAGLPPGLFGTGEARWLETQVAGETPGARTLLTSVPYALKAADAATLGGLPASAFALAGPTTAMAAVGSDGISSDSVSNVTTTGGSNLYLPRFTGASTVVNSQIYDNGTSVGIGNVPNASAKLDVNGPMIMRGTMTVSRTGNATASKAYPSYGFEFFSNAYNSSTKASDNPYFSLQSEPTGNNTSSPSATFNLLFSNNGAAPAETGFYINPNGTLNFAPGQTFPGGGSGITGITTTSPLTGSGTSGSVALALDIPSLEQNTLNYVYAGLAYSNEFAGEGIFDGPVSGADDQVEGYGVMGLSTDFYGVFGQATNGRGVVGQATTGTGVYGTATGESSSGVYGEGMGTDGAGVVGVAYGGSLENSFKPIGVGGYTQRGFGVVGSEALPTVNYAAVIGQEGKGSGTYGRVQGYGTVAAGVWGDSTDSNDVGFSIGVIGTADSAYAGYFQNDSASYSTIHAVNHNTGTVGDLFTTLMASTSNGTCGFGGAGNLTCTGQIKSLATTASNGRQVETYAMQSPENWMEDFGSGQLHGGTGFVTIDPVFADTVSDSADYHVFLTPSGDSKGLYVSDKSARGFQVRESGGGTASVAFDYRIVAKRRGIEVQRLTDVTERLKQEMQTPAEMKRTGVSAIAVSSTTPARSIGRGRIGRVPVPHAKSRIPAAK